MYEDDFEEYESSSNESINLFEI